jgi:tellurite resistance protein
MSVTLTVAKDAKRFGGPRVPPSLFGIALGVAGLALAWHAAVPVLGIPNAVPDALDVLDAVLGLVLVAAYLAQGPRIVAADLRDPVLSPFVSAAPITAMILAAALAAAAFGAGRVLVVAFLAVTIGVGGWLTGQWMTGGIDPDSIHPGYFLPTAAGGLIGANAAAQVQLHALAEASFGIGVIFWVVLSSMILKRLFTGAALPAALVPTMAIELGVASVAGSAYFAVAGRTVSFLAYALGGYAVLMVLIQVRLIPVYLRLSFTPGFWSFAFAYAAAAGDALGWLAIARPPGAAGYAIAVIALLSALVAWIAFRTVVLTVRGQLFPDGVLSGYVLGLGDAVEPVAEQGALGRGQRRETGQRGVQGYRRGGRARDGGCARVGEDGRADRFPRRIGERVVALASGLADESEHDSGAGRLDELDRPSLGHAQTASFGDPVHPGLQHPDTGRRGGPALRRAQGRVHEPEQFGVREAETDVEIPAGPQALDWIGIRVEVLARHVVREPVRDHRVEQSALVAEEPVDRGRLHAGGERDRAGGHRVRTRRGEQVSRDFHEVRTGLVAR